MTRQRDWPCSISERTSEEGRERGSERAREHASAAFFQLTDDATGHRRPITSSATVDLGLHPAQHTPLATRAATPLWTSKVTQSVHHDHNDQIRTQEHTYIKIHTGCVISENIYLKVCTLHMRVQSFRS